MSSDDEGAVGRAVIALSSVPSVVKCIEVTGKQGATAVTSRVGLGNKPTATLQLSGLPLGAVTFSAVAWNKACANVTATTEITWQSGNVNAELRADHVPEVSMTLYPVRPTTVDASFQPDFVDIQQCGLALIGTDSAHGFYAAGLSEVANPVPALPATTAKVACGPYHGCAIDSAGLVTCWGLNQRIFSSSAAVVTSESPGTFQARDIAVGLGAACAIKTDGTLTCWGNNFGGVVNPLTTADGYVGPTVPPNASSLPLFGSFTQVVLGDDFGCALRSDGNVECWGANAQGALGNDTATGSNELLPFDGLQGVVKLAAANQGMYALRGDGSLYRWGEHLTGPELVPDIDDAIDVAAGWYSVCVLRASGQVYCWGGGLSGEHGDGKGEQQRDALSTPVDFSTAFDGPVPEVLSLSSHHSSYCALHDGGKVSCWGLNESGNLADGTTNNAYTAVRAEHWDVRHPYVTTP